MQVQGSSQEAYTALLELANAAQKKPVWRKYHIRSLEDVLEPLTAKQDTTWFYRLLERVIYYVTYPFSNRKVTPYDFEENLDYLHALVQKIGEHQGGLIRVSDDLYRQLFNRFSLNVGHALSQLLERIDRIYESATFKDNNRSAALRAKIDTTYNMVMRMDAFPKLVFSLDATERDALLASAQFFETQLLQEIEKAGKLKEETAFSYAMEALEKRLDKSVEDPALVFKLRSFSVSTCLGRDLQKIVAGIGLDHGHFTQTENMNDDLELLSSCYYDDCLRKISEYIAAVRMWDKGHTFETQIDALERNVKDQFLFAATGMIETVRKQFIAQVTRDHESAEPVDAKREVRGRASHYLQKLDFDATHPLFGVIKSNMQIMRAAVTELQEAPQPET